VKAAKDKVSFTLLAGAIPCPVLREAAPVLKVVPFDRDFNHEYLKVSHLDAGDYTLSIDGKKVGTYSAADLDSGIDLATVKGTPQQAQAADVAKRNFERNKIVRNVRGLAWFERCTALEPQKLTPANIAFRDSLRADLPNMLAKIKAAGDEIHKAAQPQPRKYTIEKATAAASQPSGGARM
jgi:hypothetical protein